MCVITTREDEIAALESASVTKELKPFQSLTNALSYSRRCDDTFSNRQGGGGGGPLAGGGSIGKLAQKGQFGGVQLGAREEELTKTALFDEARGGGVCNKWQFIRLFRHLCPCQCKGTISVQGPHRRQYSAAGVDATAGHLTKSSLKAHCLGDIFLVIPLPYPASCEKGYLAGPWCPAGAYRYQHPPYQRKNSPHHQVRPLNGLVVLQHLKAVRHARPLSLSPLPLPPSSCSLFLACSRVFLHTKERNPPFSIYITKVSRLFVSLNLHVYPSRPLKYKALSHHPRLHGPQQNVTNHISQITHTQTIIHHVQSHRSRRKALPRHQLDCCARRRLPQQRLSARQHRAPGRCSADAKVRRASPRPRAQQGTSLLSQSFGPAAADPPSSRVASPPPIALHPSPASPTGPARSCRPSTRARAASPSPRRTSTP